MCVLQELKIVNLSKYYFSFSENPISIQGHRIKIFSGTYLLA